LASQTGVLMVRKPRQTDYTYQELISDIRNGRVASIYLFLGDEDFLVAQGMAALKKALLPGDEGSWNLGEFEVKIQEIKEKRYPALNDEFAKDVGDFETLLELRAHIRQHLEESAEREAERKLEEDLITEVVKRSTVDIPTKMIDRQVEHKREHLERDLQYSGLTMQQYLEIVGVTEQEMEARLSADAEQEVKTSLVMEALIDAEAINVSDEELDEHIQELAGDGPDAAMRRERWEAQKERLRDSLVVQKAVAFLKENAKISEVIVDKPDAEAEEVTDTEVKAEGQDVEAE
jgi:trigger factor